MAQNNLRDEGRTGTGNTAAAAESRQNDQRWDEEGKDLPVLVVCWV